MGESPITVRAVLEPARFPVPTGKGVFPADVAVGVARDSAEANRLANLLRMVFSFPAMLGTFLVLGAFYEARAFFVDPDLWWHITVGQNILATHHWPTTDPYSFTVAGQPWIAYEWLGEILWAVVYRVGGLRALEALLIVLSSSVMLALYYFSTLRSGNSKAGFLATGIMLTLANASFTLRPQMLGYLFLVLTLIALERFRQGKLRALWFLPVAFLLWVNTHGSFAIGLGTIFLYWVGGLKKFRLGGIAARQWTAAERVRLELVFVLCLAVLPLTPYGTQVAAYPFNVAFAQPLNIANILEWQPMPFNQLGGKIFLGLLLAFICLQVLLRLEWRLEEFALFLFGVLSACLHLRFLLLFVPFITPLLAVIFARWLPRYDRSKEHRVLNAVLITVVIAAMIRYFPSQPDLEQKVAKHYPVDALRYLSEHPAPGPTYNTYGFGGYLILAGQKVFVDGRADVFERGGVFGDYLHVSLMRPGAPRVLQGYGVRSCLLERGEPLTVLLAVMPEWQRVYIDGTSEVFVRR